MASNQECLLENGNLINDTREEEEEVNHHHGRTARQMSASSLRRKSDPSLANGVQNRHLRQLLVNLQVVLFGTKLSVLLPTIPLSIIAVCYGFGKVSAFTLLTINILYNLVMNFVLLFLSVGL